MSDFNKHIAGVYKKLGASMPQPETRRMYELKEGDCENCGGIGEIEAHGELFECHSCSGTGREDWEPKKEATR